MASPIFPLSVAGRRADVGLDLHPGRQGVEAVVKVDDPKNLQYLTVVPTRVLQCVVVVADEIPATVRDADAEPDGQLACGVDPLAVEQNLIFRPRGDDVLPVSRQLAPDGRNAAAPEPASS